MNRRAFNNLRYAHVCALIGIISTKRSRRLSQVKRLFFEVSEGFDEVLALLTDLDIVEITGDTLQLTSRWIKRESVSQRWKVMQMLLDRSNRYRAEIYEFLSQFKVTTGELVYRPVDTRRSTDSGVRNFLIDVGIVTHVGGEYMLMAEYAVLFANAKNNSNYTPPTLIEAVQERQADLGSAAEDRIVEYERSRVGPSYVSMIDHVSRRNAAAGYDIRSVSFAPGCDPIPRFIEVKAVSPYTFEFHWSRNEIDVARALSHWYYLYLLPVDRQAQFDVDRLVVVCNPCDAVLSEGSDWITEADALICRTTAPVNH